MLRHRVVAGLSQQDLARRSGLSERAIRDLERGVTARPRGHSIRAVAKALDLDNATTATFLAMSRQHGGGQPAPQAPAQTLLGREAELRALVDIVVAGRRRIVTITGAGGAGKTRLATAVVARLHGRFAPEVSTVDVSALTGPVPVAELMAEAFGCGGVSRLGPVDRIAAQIRNRRALIVLDGFERVVAAGSAGEDRDLADLTALHRRCPGLTVLITSQRPLRLTGEREVRLAPLDLDTATRLFEAAAGARPAAQDRDAIREICGRLDGLPLAIELAAAQMGLLSPAELLERLDRPLALLTRGARDLPARHRSLRTTIEATLAHVGAPANTLFDWLGAFRGGVRLDDLEAVLGTLGKDRAWLLDALAELVDTSLVRTLQRAGATRYLLPAALRELAGERLTACDDIERAVAVHYLRRLPKDDADNVRAAIAWAVEHEPDLIDEAAIHRYFEVAGRLAEGVATLALVGAAGRPHGWVRAGQLARLRGDLAEAARLGGLALRDLDPADHGGLGTAHLLLGSIATDQRDAQRARRHIRTALIRGRRAGDLGLVGRALNNLGTLSTELGRLADAERLLHASLRAKRRAEAGDLETGRTLFNLAETALDAGSGDLAAGRAAEAVRRLRGSGHDRPAAVAAVAPRTRALAPLSVSDTDGARAAAMLATSLLDPSDDRRAVAIIGLRCSVAWHAAGDTDTAVSTLRRVLPMALDSTERDVEEAANALEAHAAICRRRRPDLAAGLLGASARLRVGATRPVSDAIAAVAVKAAAGSAEALGDRGYARWHRAGTRLDRDGLLNLCAQLGDAPSRTYRKE